MDPDKNESFSVSYNSTKDYFFAQKRARHKASFVKFDAFFGEKKKVKKVRFVDGLNTTLSDIPPAYDSSTSWGPRGSVQHGASFF